MSLTLDISNVTRLERRVQQREEGLSITRLSNIPYSSIRLSGTSTNLAWYPNTEANLTICYFLCHLHHWCHCATAASTPPIAPYSPRPNGSTLRGNLGSSEPLPESYIVLHFDCMSNHLENLLVQNQQDENCSL